MVDFTERLRIVLEGDEKGALRALRSVGEAAKKTGAEVKDSQASMSRSATLAGAGMIGAAGLLGGALFASAKKAAEAEQAHLQLSNTIRQMPQLIDANVAAFDRQQKALQDTTRYSDEEVAAAQSMLGQFGLTQDQIIKLTPHIADIAAKMGVGLADAAQVVGKALETGQTKGLKAWGINATLAADPTQRLTQIIDGLSNKAGGFAAQDGKTMSGQLTILRHNMDDLEESIGTAVIPVLEDMVKPIADLVSGFNHLPEPMKNTIGAGLGVATAVLGVGGAISFGIGQYQKFSGWITTVGEKLGVSTAATEAQTVATGEAAVALDGQAASETAAAVAAGDLAAANQGVAASNAEVAASAGVAGAAAEGAGVAAGGVEAASIGAAAGLGTLGVGLAAVAPLALGAGAAIGIMSIDLDNVNKQTRQLASDDKMGSLFENIGAKAGMAGQTIEQYYQTALEGMIAQTPDLSDAMQKLGINMDDVYAALLDQPGAFARIESAMSDTSEKAAGLTGTQKRLIDSLWRTTADASEVYPANKKQLADYTAAVDKMGKITQDAGGNVADAAGAQGDFGDTTKLAAEKAKEESDAFKALAKDAQALGATVQALADDEYATIDASKAYTRAQIELADKQAAVTEKTKAYEQTLRSHDSSKVQQAYRELQTAILDVSDAQEKVSQTAYKLALQQLGLTGKWDDASKQKIPALIAQLKTMQTTLDPKSALYQDLQSYINTLNHIPTDIKVNIDQQFLTNNGTKPSSYRKQPVGHAAGGSFGAGEPILVGESGTELVTFDQPGYVTPHNQLPAIQPVQHQHEYNITVQCLDPQQAGPAIVEALRKFNRERGAIPIRVAS